MNEVKKLLVEAKGLIETVGWCQDQYAEYDDDGEKAVAYCSLGAINIASNRYDGGYHAKSVLANVVGGKSVPDSLAPKPTTSSTIAQWNDTEGRTKEEVIAAFDKAIKLAGGKIQS